MKYHGLCAVAASALFLSVSAADFGSFLEKRAGIWSSGAADLVRDYPGKFRWLDQSKKQARAIRTKTDTLTLYGDPLQEVIVTLDSKKQLGSVVLSIYNRGDAGEWDRDRFEEKLDLVRDKLSGFAGGKKPESQSAALGNGAKLFANIWRTPELDLMLRWSSTNRKEPEYITLELLPPGEAPKNLRASLKSTAGAGNLSEQVKQDAAGSRYLEIPMVDQGGKGYCVAATVERILRYYGSDIDQHVIAQLAASDANAGTSFEAMVDALEAADSRLGVRFKRHYEYKSLLSYRGVERLCKEYNSAAQKLKKERLKFNDFVVTRRKTKTFQLGQFLSALDPEVYSAVRMRDKSNYEEFVKLVRESIDDGVPLCWGILAVAGQKGGSDANFSAHMRIINGYNPQSGDIIYTDSWGFGHEKKQMTAEEAWSITNTLCSLVPRTRRAPGR